MTKIKDEVCIVIEEKDQIKLSDSLLEEKVIRFLEKEVIHEFKKL